MLRRILFFSLVFIVLLSETHLVFAKNQIFGKLEKIRQIINITDDLEENTEVFIVTKSEDGNTVIDCVCACRDALWSCTTTECSAQDNKCEN